MLQKGNLQEMEKDNNKGGMMSVIAALGANVLVAISKFVGFAVSGSAAMLNESIHSICLLYTSPSPRDPKTSRMPSSA